MLHHGFLFQVSTFLLLYFSSSLAFAAPPAFFIFGDSLVDNGNNNYLATSARADSPPYGIDFYPSRRPTGRFSNGLTMPDLISEKIGAAETALPYLSPELVGDKLLVGANFASAGIGILNDTGIQFVNIIKIYDQMKYFEEYKERVGAMIGEERMQELVRNCLVLITLGGNDFVNNYYLVPFSLRSRQYQIPQYCTLLVSEYRKILLRLYQLGVKKVMVTGTGPMGCVPAVRAMRGRNGECSEELQRAASIFNPLLVSAISSLNSQIGSTVFIIANAYQMKMDVITNPQSYGFVTSRDACCGQGLYNGIGLCNVASNLCSNREIYVFWDQYHPTERTTRIIVDTLFSGSQSYMYPMNLSSILR